MIAVGNKILQVIKEHKSGMDIGITSVCSANRYAIKAAIVNAKKIDKMVLIESTSNQVDQFGGYTGMRPNDFRNFVFEIAESVGFPKENIILGGDHLGPNVWQNKDSNYAMENAKGQISAYIKAGYSKIHLDTSMKCADDGDPNIPLEPAVVAERAALLCKTAEETFKKINKESAFPVYIVGTDVPSPGGAKTEHEAIAITTPEQVEETIELTRQAFRKNNLEDAWERVIAVVVQPGVEFGEAYLFNYERMKARELVSKIEKEKNCVYEAHSTDYQLKESLRQMVHDHFAILKVGPWLTFAFREAVFALEMIEKELFVNKKSVNLSELANVVEQQMKNEPNYWAKYYHDNDEKDLYIKLKYSFSDRIRYYWPDAKIKDSLTQLIKNLSGIEIPLTLLSQFLPRVYEKLRNKEINNSPNEFIISKILDVLCNYNYATTGKLC